MSFCTTVFIFMKHDYYVVSSIIVISHLPHNDVQKVISYCNMKFCKHLPSRIPHAYVTIRSCICEAGN